MSGEETLAQVNREIAHPKLKNLEKTGLVIFIYSLLFTSLVSFFAVMIIPDNVRPTYFGNLIGGIAWFLVGPEWAQAGLPRIRGVGRRPDSVRRSEYRPSSAPTECSTAWRKTVFSLLRSRSRIRASAPATASST